MEGEKITMAAKVDTDKCTGCGLCVEACPVEAITLENEKAKVDEGTCVDCGACVSECPNEAISVD
jgi:ferredoxin